MFDKPVIDEDALKRFLLGNVPETEAERLDELSVTDDDVAARLQAVENDLVDAYVRGALSGEEEQRFKARYLTTPAGRTRVTVAEALLARESARRPRAFAPWAIAASVLLIVLAAGFFIIKPKRNDVRPTVSATTPLTRTAAERIPITASILLLPPTRGNASLASVDVTSAENLVLTLQLEANDFPSYKVSLRDVAQNAVVCQEEHTASTFNGNPSVTVECPAAALQDRNYTAELAGLPASGQPEVIAGYTFHVIRKEPS